MLKDRIERMAKEYANLHEKVGVIGISCIGYGNGAHMRVHLTQKGLSRLFEGQTPSYEVNKEDEWYEKYFHYNGVKFFALLDREEYERELETI